MVPSIRRWLAVAVIGLLLATMSLPLTMAPQTALAQGSTVTLNTYQGPSGSSVTATGHYWVAGDTIHVLWGGTSGPDIKQGTVDGNGNFSIPFQVPQPPVAVAGNYYTIIFWDEQQRTFQVPPNSFLVTSSTISVTVDQVFTRDGKGNKKTTFGPGDAIQYAEIVNNHNSTSVTATFAVRVTDPSGNVVFSSQWNQALPSGVAGVYTPSTVPKNGPQGTYTFQVTVTYNGVSSQGKSQFTVLPFSTTYPLLPLGGVDMNGYCKSIGDQGASLDGNNAYNWNCVTQSGSHVPFSVTAACQWQYKDTNALDVFLDFNNPQSWKCYAGIANLGSPNFDNYCKSLGDQGASLDGSTAYDWRCVTQAGDHVFFLFWSACNWQYTGQKVARVGNFYDPNSWQCWKAAALDAGNIYAGYGLAGRKDHPLFMDLKGSWTVPQAQNCSFYQESQSAAWIGISGDGGKTIGNNNLAQIGTESACTKSTLPTYFAVYQMYPGQQPAVPIIKACSDSNSQTCTQVSATVNAGDKIVAEVQYQGQGLFKLAIQDTTQKWHTGGKGTTLPPQSQSGSDLAAARTHAEWIVESPSGNLTNFGKVQFSNCSVDNISISGGSFILKFVMMSKNNTTKVLAEPLGLPTSGTGFTVKWFSSGP